MKWLLALLSGVLGLVCVSCGSPTMTTSSPARPETSPAAPSQQVLLDVKGSGSNTTQKFSAAGDWNLEWSYDCTAGLSLSDGQCSFIVHIKDSSSSFSRNQGVTQLAKKGQGVEHYHAGGTFYLEVQLCCVQGSWAVKVIG
jgi:hypothetical protein